METDWIIERERYLIDQIREIDSEELQIEEVDDLPESSDEDDFSGRGYGGAYGSAEFTFDPCLTSLHSYLGEVEYTRNRLAFLDGGAILNLPLLYLEGVVLFPEATLPLRVIQPNFIAAVERALGQAAAAAYTLGVVRVYRDTGNGKIQLSTTGTTAEIRQFRRLDDGSLNVVTRGKQRFHLRHRWIDVDGAPCGEIQIIQEDSPLRTPRDVVGQLEPLRNFHSASAFQAKGRGHENEGDDSDALSEDSFTNELSLTERRLHESALASSSCGSDLFDDSTSGENANLEIENKIISDRQSCRGVGWKKDSVSRFREVPKAYWPAWVYRMYDSYCLAQQVADMWTKIVKAPSMDGLVKKPDVLSYHIASKIPVSESTRQELLEIDGVSYRLRREIELLESFDCVRCKTCQTVIARRSDMLVMSSDGPLGAYVNSSGFVHEILTLLIANGLALIGNPVKEYSWFPGYAWTIAYCATCECQMGWRFTATNKNLNPPSFWGIRSSQVADDTC